MAQAKDVAAMRMRIQRRGYSDVKVERVGEGYMVRAIEPLAGMGVQVLIKPEAVRFVCR